MSPRRSLYGWLAAEGVSLVGTRVSMVALPFFVLTTTGSPQKTGLVAGAELLPMVVSKVLGGPAIDRAGARRVALVCDAGSVLVVGAVPLLHDAGVLSFPALSATAAVPMERVTGLSSTVERTASMLGAALAGGLVAVAGPADALLLDAASFGVSALLLAWALPAGVHGRSEAEGDGAPYGERLRAGWRFLRGDRVLVGITVMVALTNLLDVGLGLGHGAGLGRRAGRWCRGGRGAVRDLRGRVGGGFAPRGGVRRAAAAPRDVPGLLPGRRTAAVRGHGLRHPALGCARGGGGGRVRVGVPEPDPRRGRL